MTDGCARIAVIGIGHVGLPLCLTIAEAGLSVVAIDSNEATTRALQEGRSHLDHVPDERVTASVGRLAATADIAAAASCQAVLICVPTPICDAGRPDLGAVECVARDLAHVIAPDTLVVLESTSWPGTAAEVVLPLLEKGPRRLGVDLFVAASPEREDPGNHAWTTKTIPKLVGGVDEASGDRAEACYGNFIDTVVRCPTAAVAEMAKLYENIYRNINIALATEVEQALEANGIDFQAVLAAAATKPFGFQAFFAGIGVGGPCIPVNPAYYRSWLAARGTTCPLIEQALAVNEARPSVIVDRIQTGLKKRDVATDQALIGFARLSYKPSVEDQRHSPALQILAMLEERGIAVRVGGDLADCHCIVEPDGITWQAQV